MLTMEFVSTADSPVVATYYCCLLAKLNEHNTNVIHQPATSCLQPTIHSNLVYAYGIVAIQKVKIKEKRNFILLERNYGMWKEQREGEVWW